jgi:hypothetical protein
VRFKAIAELVDACSTGLLTTGFGLGASAEAAVDTLEGSSAIAICSSYVIRSISSM